MNRSIKYWVWLLADLSLDRAAAVLPLIGFPTVDFLLFRRCLQALGPHLHPFQENLDILFEEIRKCFTAKLGDGSDAVDAWLRTFPFADEESMPAANYWNSRFADILALDPAPAPSGIDAQIWEAVSAAYRGEKPKPGHSWTVAFDRAASVIRQQRIVSRAIESARSDSLTSYDLDLYLRFGWNDHGTQKGLSSLEIGSRLSSVISFWRAVSEHIPAQEVEELAYRRDLQTWEAAANPASFIDDAQRYGVSPEQMASEIFPKPSPPPKLDALYKEP